MAGHGRPRQSRLMCPYKRRALLTTHSLLFDFVRLSPHSLAFRSRYWISLSLAQVADSRIPKLKAYSGVYSTNLHRPAWYTSLQPYSPLSSIYRTFVWNRINSQHYYHRKRIEAQTMTVPCPLVIISKAITKGILLSLKDGRLKAKGVCVCLCGCACVCV